MLSVPTAKARWNAEFKSHNPVRDENVSRGPPINQ